MARLHVPRFVAWLAIPLSAALALALGHLWAYPTVEVEANQFDEILEIAPIQQPQQLVIELLKPDGSPAQGAVAILLKPEFAVAYADADGRATLHHFQSGPARIQAYLPGHDLISKGPLELDAWPVLTFVEREQPVIPILQPEELVRHDLMLRDRSGGAITDVQVVATAPSSDGSFPPKLQVGVEPSRYLVPWIAFADDDGWARLDGVPRILLTARAYPLGFPLEDAWQLGEIEVRPAPDGESNWNLQTARLQISGLPHNEALQLERMDVPGQLPLRRVPESGEIEWLVLPPGSYRATVRDEFRDWILRSGSNQQAWTNP